MTEIRSTHLACRLAQKSKVEVLSSADKFGQLKSIHIKIQTSRMVPPTQILVEVVQARAPRRVRVGENAPGRGWSGNAVDLTGHPSLKDSTEAGSNGR